MNPPNQPEPKQDLKNFQVETKPDGQGEVSLREEEIEHILASAFQDGFGAAHNPKYRNRTVEHTKRIMALHEADKAAAVREVLERLHRSEGESLPKRDYDNVTDELIDEELARLQPPTAGEGERGKV